MRTCGWLWAWLAIGAVPAAGCADGGAQATPAPTAARAVEEQPRLHPALDDLSPLPSALQRAFHHHADFQALGEPEEGEWRDHFEELGQTVAEFRDGVRQLPSEARRTLHIEPLGSFREGESPPLDVLEDYVERFFGLDAVVLPAVPLARLGPVPRRVHHGVEQLRAPVLLEAMLARVPEDSYGLMAVTMHDIYPAPGWNYVFGLATFSKRVGVHSFARYDPSFFGAPRTADTQQRMLERALKVMAHELGHMFGLAHCTHYHCVMNGTNSLEQTDRMAMDLCPVCLRKLHLAVGQAPIERYRRLLAFQRIHGLHAQARWTASRIAYIQAGAGPAPEATPKPAP